MFVLPPDEFDIDTSFKVEAALRCLPPPTREGFERIAKSATRQQAEIDAKHARKRTLRDSARDDYTFMNDYDRAVRRGETITKEYEARYKAACAGYQAKNVEIKKLEKEGMPANLPLNAAVSFAVDYMAGPRDKFVSAPTEVKLKGQTLTVALSVARDKIAQIDGQRKTVLAAPLPETDVEKRFREDVSRHALAPDGSGAARIRTTPFGLRSSHDVQGHVRWPTARISHDGGGVSEVDEGLRVLCWLDPEKVVARLMADLKASYKGKTPLSVEQREAKLAELDALRLETEREEEAIVRLLEDGGVTVYRRPKASIEAVLQIRRA